MLVQDATGTGYIATTTSPAPTRRVANAIVVGDTHIDVDARFGGVGADDTAMLQYALDSAPIGCILHLPNRQVTITDQLVMTRFMHIRGHNALQASFTDPNKALLKVKISEFGTTGNARCLMIEGGNWYSLTHVGAIIHMVCGVTLADGAPLLNFQIFNGLFTEAQYGIRISNLDNHFGRIDNNTIGGSIAGVFIDGTADGHLITRNVIAGTGVAVIFNLANGAFAQGVMHNALVADGGAVEIQNGDLCYVMYNQIEQPRAGNLLGGSHVLIRGNSRIARNNRIMHNNFGGGGFIQTSVTVFNGRYNVLDYNQFGLPTYQDVNFSNAAGAGLEARYNTFGPNNGYRGSRSLQTPASVPIGIVGTDTTRRAIIADSGIGNRGFYKPWSVLNLQGQWTSSGLGVGVDSEGRLMHSGMLTGGSLAGGTLIGTYPEGMRSRDTLFVPVGTSGGLGALTIGNNGALTSGGLPAASVSMTPVAYPVDWMNVYEPGPA